MAEDVQLKPCSFFLVRYVPDIVRGEGLNIGLFLYSPQEEYLDCLFTDDFRRIRSFHAQADLDLLKDLPQHFEGEIRRREDRLDDFVREMQESYANLIQVTSPRTCLAADPQSELQNLFSRYVGTRHSAALAQDTRMRVKQRLTDALRRHGVLDRVEKRVPAAQWTGSGDPFTFDYGYRPLEAAGKPNGHVKLIHALSLQRDNDLAHVLANLMVNYVRKKEPAELTAVVEGLPGAGDETALHSQRILADAQIALQPIAGLDDYAQSIRQELA
ncbi:MAG: DUF3037 domain-containing protein [Acidobacteria bacterium]|nr:DUF3037 domain-containing protein [Acidobacteriota bacterium]